MQQYLEDFDCYETMSIIGQDDFPLFNCNNKYLKKNTTVAPLLDYQNDNLNCTQDQIRYVWEDEFWKGNPDRIGFSSNGFVGCLNNFCCDSALYFVKAKYDYMVFFAMISAFLGLANYSTLIAFITH